MGPLAAYLHDVWSIHASGAALPETSYYPALRTLLDAAGHDLDPRVRCVMNLSNRSGGMPDGGLFTADQLRGRSDSGTGAFAVLPARGAIEAKPPTDDVPFIARGEQVDRYLEAYGQVLVTNLRDFALVVRGSGRRPLILDRYTLAPSAPVFWTAAGLAAATEQEHGVRFLEFLRRALLHGAPLTRPRDVAAYLASCAREARYRTDRLPLGTLAHIRVALEETLGVSFTGERGEHLFRSTLVQTLFYGVFSAWVLWSRRQAPDSDEQFDWHDAAWFAGVPMIKALYEQISTPTQLRTLDLVEVLDWAGRALNRVDHEAFFSAFEEGQQAVQYFYEPFLEAFDPDLRKELGVWYTPNEVVRYMVARVDTVLREELGLAEGLADPSVYVLDPACGTGSYLVEVIKRIALHLQERGADALTAQELKRAAMRRVIGFEIIPAPFVVAHLQIGLLLENLGAPLAPGRERAAVYLTNSLTGWSTDETRHQRAYIPELEAERDAAERVKHEMRVLVVLGNPPYNGFAGLAMAEERDLVEAYRHARHTRQPQGQGLNDLYVRFYRMAEREIVERTGAGIVCFISNYSWLDGLSFPAMRERYLEAFDRIWIDNLHGDRIISEYARDGKSSETVFATRGMSPGIKVGTTIAILARREQRQRGDVAQVLYRDLEESGAEERRKALIDGLRAATINESYQEITPSPDLGFPFKPREVGEGYFAWPLLPELFPTSFPGVKTSRDADLVDIDRDRLEQRIRLYFDPNVSDAEMRRVAPSLMEASGGFDPVATRRQLLQRGFQSGSIMRYLYRPFDLRWLYWESETKLLDRNRADYVEQVFPGNVWFSAGQRNRKSDFYLPQVATVLADHHLVESNVGMFPYRLRSSAVQASLFDNVAAMHPNLSELASRYLSSANRQPDHLFHHLIAVLHSAAYRLENGGALRQDWPRLPLPASGELLDTSAELGRHLAALLDPLQPLPGVTSGAVRRELRAIATVERAGGGFLDPETGDLSVTAGWGHGGRGGIVMPARGRLLERDYTPVELAAIAAGAAELGIDEERAFALLGRRTCDIYLNERAYWSNVPARVWEYSLGGYQVIKKWLSYRELALLGRPLTLDEVREVSGIARRIAAILLLEPALDASYQRVKANLFQWTR